MYQSITIIGNLGADPELRYTPSGDAVTSFSVATSRKWKGADGTTGEETTWFRVSVWGRQAETCNQYLSKGRQVYVEGSMSQDKESGGPRLWQDNEGNWRASYEIRAYRVLFLGSRSDSDSTAQRPVDQESGPFSEEDIPF